MRTIVFNGNGGVGGTTAADGAATRASFTLAARVRVGALTADRHRTHGLRDSDVENIDRGEDDAWD